MKNKHINFEEMVQDAGSGPIRRIDADTAGHLISSQDITSYDRKMITSTVAELAYTANMFRDIRVRPKVTIFGSARTPQDDPDYQICKHFGKLMTDLGYMVITGAGPGIMAAGHEGAGVENSIGVNIDLPFEQGVNEFIAQSKYLVTYRYFFTRKLTFVREADAVALFPGGFGTMDEAFEVLTLMQTGRAMPVPFVLIEKEGGTYWREWEKFVRKGLFDNGMISEDDFNLFRIYNNIEEAADYINNFYRRYHSLRYIGDKVVIRLNTPLPESLLADLREEYADFFGDYGMQKSEALPEEQDEPDLLNLPRLVLKANRKQPVRLYCLIRSLNREIDNSSTQQPHTNPRPQRHKLTGKDTE